MLTLHILVIGKLERERGGKGKGKRGGKEREREGESKWNITQVLHCELTEVVSLYQ